eukprot:458108_1
MDDASISSISSKNISLKCAKKRQSDNHSFSKAKRQKLNDFSIDFPHIKFNHPPYNTTINTNVNGNYEIQKRKRDSHSNKMTQFQMESLLYDEWRNKLQVTEHNRAKQYILKQQTMEDEDTDLDFGETKIDSNKNRIQCYKNGIIFSVNGDETTIMDQIKQNIIIRINQIFGKEVNENDIIILDNNKNRCIYMDRTMNEVVQLMNLNTINDILFEVQQR